MKIRSKTLLAVALLFSWNAASAQAPDSISASPSVSTVPPQGPSGGAGVSAVAPEEKKADGKFVIMVRPPLAFSLPLGSSEKNKKLRHIIAGVVPSRLDIGYMVNASIMLGIYAQYGIVLPEGGMDGGSDFRLGIQGLYRISLTEKVHPWFGAGIGYESESMSGEDSYYGSESASMSGMEFADLQVGLDLKLSRLVSIGQFAGLSIGQYSSYSNSDPAYGPGTSGSIKNKAVHEWLTSGVFLAFHF
jgi:hypothetical protein